MTFGAGMADAYYQPDDLTPTQERAIESGAWHPDQEEWADFIKGESDDARLEAAGL